MASKYFEMIGNLANEIKKDGRTWKIIAKRVLDDYDETYDYSRYKFLCPFHNDKHNKNFDVKANHYHCYACGEEGSILDFVMNFDNLSFKEAVIQASYELDIIDKKTYNNLKKGKTFNTSYAKKTTQVKETRNKIANREDLNYAYSLFSKGLTWLGKPLLNDAHLQHLKECRHLTDEEIQQNGYFTFPSLYVLKHIIKQLKADGKDEDFLYHIPGFFYDNKKERTSFMLLKNNKGIGIPIKDVDGYIVGIQVRLDTIKEGEQRYVWFSSNFASNSKGTSPGVPIDVCYPNGISSNNLEDVKYQTIFITEGHFKAIKLAKTFQSVALSVQGVHNWREMPYVLDALKKLNPKFKHVYIMYDADMSYKESVLQPAIKLGLSLTNLSFKDCKNDVEDILSVNRKHKKPLKEMVSSFQKVDSYLRKNAGVYKFDITYCIWDDDIGKGIDDYLDSFDNIDDATKGISKIQLILFWEFAFNYLRLNEDTKEKMKLRDGLEDSSNVVLSEDIKKDNFDKEIQILMSKYPQK